MLESFGEERSYCVQLHQRQEVQLQTQRVIGGSDVIAGGKDRTANTWGGRSGVEFNRRINEGV